MIADTSAPEALPLVPRSARLALMACMFLITASMGFLQPFVPLYLEASGLSRQQIGVVSGMGAGLAFLIQPLLGAVSDWRDARRPLMSGAALCAGLAYVGYRFAHGMGAFLLLSALGLNGTFYLNAVGGVLVGQLVQGTRHGGSGTHASAYGGPSVTSSWRCFPARCSTTACPVARG